MNDTQLDALQQWAHRHGRRWKMHLRDAWTTGDYGTFELSAELQQIRNEKGPAWLRTFRLPRFVEVPR